MIKDIPTSDEFDSAAMAQLDFAWDIVVSFLVAVDTTEQYIDVDDFDKQEYWVAAKQRVITALSLVQQGTELAIKGKIAEVSPYILLLNNKKWGNSQGTEQIEFSDCKTIDAHDLITIHNSVAKTPFDNKFNILFNKLRSTRNKAMHTVARDLDVTAKKVIEYLLQVNYYLHPDRKWAATRKQFLHNSPSISGYFADDAREKDAQLATEFISVVKILTSLQREQFLGLKEDVEMYYCPMCTYVCNEFAEAAEPKYAQLVSNDDGSPPTSLFCFLCDAKYDIDNDGVVCIEQDCDSSVISLEHDICCSCGSCQTP
jgi:rubrerythrin